jgi:predicted Zn-dependent protease
MGCGPRAGRATATVCSRLRHALAWALIACVVLSPLPSIAQDLPDIGSPSDAVLSREREQQIGRAIYRSLADTERVITDPEVSEYLQDLGQRLAVHAQDGNFQFQFFAVGDPAINAFALPGGYIGVHSGLVLATSNESELAGVLAHEISHVTQRHVSRAIYANQRASILTMAAMLGAILVGAAGGGGDVIAGAVATAQGVAAQQQINFTRASEYEADRVGVGVLAASGLDPMAMPEFFEMLARQSGPLASEAPEFLRTHPVTVSRIAETRERAAAYPKVDAPDSAGYELTRARLRVLTSGTPENALAYFRGEQQDPKKVGSLGTEYGVALSLMDLGGYEEARDIFRELLAANPGVIALHSSLASAEMAMGRPAEAFRLYEEAMVLFPRNVPLTVRYAEALLRADRPKPAHKVLLDLFNNVPPTIEQVRLIAVAASAAGDTADAHYYMAELHLMRGDAMMAANQLRVALTIPGLDNIQRARFSSRLEQVQEWIDEEKPRRRPATVEPRRR